MLAALANLWHRSQPGLEWLKLPRVGDISAWFFSLVVHSTLLVALTSLTLLLPSHPEVSLAPIKVEVDLVPEELHFSELPAERVGAGGDAPPNSVDRFDTAAAAAPIEADISQIAYDLKPSNTPSDMTVLDFDRAVFEGPIVSQDLLVKGAGSVGTSAASGAIDRLTNEILLSLDERPTMVVWLFDQSGSLRAQRESIAKRFDHIYDELGVIEASGNAAFKRHSEQPLLTAVAEFGVGVKLLTPKPTDNLSEIKAAVRSVEDDTAGKGRENVFQSVRYLAEKFRSVRLNSPRRNVMIVVFTDEAGDDVESLDPAVETCRKYEMPVFVVGVPAPFGRVNAFVKYIDPDPNYDQSPQKQHVHTGPESLLPERIKVMFGTTEENEEQYDSGFGPFGLCRLAYETGGLYFTVHPNREVGRRIPPWETAAMSTYLSAFFDARVMRNYRPDYVSAKQYKEILTSNHACAALAQASQLPAIEIGNVRLRFPKIDEGRLAADLSTAQRDAAKVEPEIEQLLAVLKQGEKDRDKLTKPRWQAGYDLAIGQALAFKVRTESYNALLAQAKQGMKFQNEKNDTWELRPIETAKINSALAKDAEAARMYLTRVVADHQGTPWAMDAQRELNLPLSWEWHEAFSNLAARQAQVANNNPRPQPTTPQPPPKPRRPPPEL